MKSNVRHTMAVCAVLLGLSAGVPAGAQSRTDREMMKAQSELTMAEAALASAEAAGAAVLAKPLFDEATAQVRQARGKWNDTQRGMREDATLRAVEARYAANAAEAQAALVSANTEIRNLQTDIGNFGGTTATLALYEPAMNISRGVTSVERVIVAENALKNARAAGGDMVAAGELKQAEATLKTARLLTRNRKQNESADHLAYVAEMQARRAEYIARRNAIVPQLAALRSERTRLAQQAVDNRARDEQNLRLAVEQQAADLRRQLEAESANRQAEQAELERLRQQVAQNELQREREESDRRRVEAESARAAAIAESERKRFDLEAQSEQLRQQVAQQQARTAETEAELARARDELARRDTATRERIESMQQELSKLAQTRTSERGFIVTLPGLFFDSGKAVLKPGARNTLAKIADQLKTNQDARIEIEGHTDSVGTDALNQALSEKRAAAVRDYLASRGLPATRITMAGLGEGSPVAFNDTAAGRQQNRRVELVIAPASQLSSQ